MATRKVTLTIDEWTFEMAGKVAANADMSTSAWISAAVRREAVRLGVGPDRRSPAEIEAEFLADEAELSAGDDRRAPG